MTRFLAQRFLQMLGVFLIISLVIFMLLVFTGDPIELLLPPAAGVDQVEAMRRHLGLDRPWYVQYVRFLGSAVRGDLGTSFYFNEPAIRLVLERLPASLELVLWTMVVSTALAIPLGVMAAARAGSWVDRAVLVASLVGISAPTFWIGIVLIALFVVALGVLPSSGRGGWEHLVLPVLTLAFYRVALFVRLIRSGMLDVLGQDYIRTARAKGLLERIVIYRHALKNTLIPFITIGGLQMGGLIAFAVVTEKIFAWPGMGRLLLISIERLDYPVVVAYAIVTAAVFVVINLTVDVLYALVDPRIRYE
ncbi:MAG: ABC transporter permease [Armatimonadota bacterium]|nr:ABC transporter permease [Armatimonadota bacterium]MDR7532013.1 ABC transporter permease [Armatimonadota bacterium]MDR7535944.1 ABC transporter permease [Armatimonadota bacterium]